MTAPLSAHHAVTAEFDQNKPITFTGTIKVVEWANPHIYTQVEVKGPDGKTVVYRVEGAAPNSLFRQGWRPDTLKPGDVVTVSGIRSKSDTSTNIERSLDRNALREFESRVQFRLNATHSTHRREPDGRWQPPA
jgi:hypothetical protein